MSAAAWAYRQLTSMRVALILLIVFALLTLAGTLIAQTPAAIKGDPRAYAEWLEEMRPRYGGWTGVLAALGLFSVFSSIWFKATVGLLSVSLITCSLRRSPRIWRTAARPKMVMTEAFFARAPQRAEIATPLPREAALASLRKTMRRHGYHTKLAREGEDVHVCADRFRWGPFGRIVSHLSFVVIIAAAVITATGGFREEAFAVPIGERKAVGNGTDLAIEARSFTDSYYLSGEPRDYASDLVLYDGGRPVSSKQVRVNHPLRHDGVTVYQSFFGPAVVMRATDRDGRVVFERGVPLLFGTKDEKHRVGRISLPEHDLRLFVVSPESGRVDPRIGAGQVQLEAYRASDDAQVALRVISEGSAKRIGNLDFSFVRERQFTGLIVARDPGTTLIWVGSTLLIAGMCMVFFFPHRRVRAVVRLRSEGSSVGIASIRRRDPLFERQFQHLAGDVRRSVGTATAPEPQRGVEVHA